MRTKRAFVPAPLNGISRLEDRVVLSSGARFLPNGAAIVTNRALSRSASDIREAFENFAGGDRNYGQLNSNLRNAVSRIPYNRRSGLADSMNFTVSQLRDDIEFRAPRPVRSAYQFAMSNLRDSVRFSVDDGSVVVR